MHALISKIVICLIGGLLCSCAASVSNLEPGGTPQPQPQPDPELQSRMTDLQAGPETVELFGRLLQKTQEGSGMMFGHQSSNMQGSGFGRFDPAKLQSDVLLSVNDLPAVFGYDFNRGFEQLLPIALQAAEAGGIITISFHMKYPGYKSYHYADISKEVPDPVVQVLPDGRYHDLFLKELDKVADFARKLTLDSRPVPILFRPWHEHTGGWYWWGSNACTPEEYCRLWKFTVEYLRDVKQVHNLIYAFSPSKPGEHGNYTYRNPGAEWFDIAGFDFYYSDGYNADAFCKSAEMAVDYARKHGKIAAICEFGYKHGINGCPNPQWFTRQFLEPLTARRLISPLAYCLTWQDGEDSRWIPLKADIHHADFVRFHNSPEIHFLKEL